MKIYKTAGYEELSRKAANIIVAQITLKPASVLGLATGSTPVGIYAELVRRYEQSDLDFSELTTFNLDEYLGLSKDDPQSYYYFMQQHLFSKVNMPAERIHIPSGKADPADLECQNYEQAIKVVGGIDLQLLGIGNNGHIGFNEPDEFFEKTTHCVDLDEKTIQANARFFSSVDEVPRRAITMGIGSIMQAKKILLVASGKSKQEILEKSLYGPITPAVPASALQLHPDVTVVYCE